MENRVRYLGLDMAWYGNSIPLRTSRYTHTYLASQQPTSYSQFNNQLIIFHLRMPNRWEFLQQILQRYFSFFGIQGCPFIMSTVKFLKYYTFLKMTFRKSLKRPAVKEMEQRIEMQFTPIVSYFTLFNYQWSSSEVKYNLFRHVLRWNKMIWNVDKLCFM